MVHITINQFLAESVLEKSGCEPRTIYWLRKNKIDQIPGITEYNCSGAIRIGLATVGSFKGFDVITDV